jgi:hypothetical protein
VVVHVVGFRSAKWPGPTQPGLVRPGPARPWRPQPPHAPLLSLSHLDLPRNNLPLPPPPLSPRGALGIRDGDHRNLGPEMSSPPLLLSLSLSLSLLFFLPHARPPFPLLARGPARPCSRAAAPPRPLLAGARWPPARGGARSPPPARPARPRRGLRPPARPRPLRALFWPLAWFAWPRASPFTASAFPRARPAFALISFGW